MSFHGNYTSGVNHGGTNDNNIPNSTPHSIPHHGVVPNLLQNQQSFQGIQNRQPIYSTSSSYTSTTSPSNFTSFSYNSPSVHPPSQINTFQPNSFNSRSDSVDNLNNSSHISNINNNTNSSLPLSTSNNSFTQSSFLMQYQSQQSIISSSFTPAGRRSLLTSKLQAQSQNQQQQQQQQQQQFNPPHINPRENLIRRTSNNSFHSSSYVTPSHVSSSYTINNTSGTIPSSTRSSALQFQSNFQSNDFYQSQQQRQHQLQHQTQTAFPPYPTPATATTDISKDLAFSTNSSSSTLYQDAQSQTNITNEFNQFSFDQALPQQQSTQFISASAPAFQTSTEAQSKNHEDHFENQYNTEIPDIASQPVNSESNTDEHLNIADYPVDDLLIMLSALLQKILEANDLLHTDEDKDNHSQSNSTEIDTSNGLLNNKYAANVLAFHGRNIPAISLHAYLTRILKYCPVTNDVFLSLLVYFDRIAKRANNNEGKTKEDEIMMDEDTENQSSSNEKAQVFVMDSYNIHRLIISGITVASKFFSDVFYKNSRYAKVGGLPLDELNHLELQFLSLLDFRLMIQVEELERYGDLLLKFWRREESKKKLLSQNQQDSFMQD